MKYTETESRIYLLSRRVQFYIRLVISGYVENIHPRHCQIY